MNKEEFIKKAKLKHGEIYDYSKTVYLRSTEDVEIICSVHGSFFQTPANHLRGRGCPLCANEKRGRKRLTTEELISRSKKIHGDKYDYSQTEYNGSNNPIEIICPKHGLFSMPPFSHLNGQGCPKCSGRNLSTDDLIGIFKEIHGDYYDYSRVEYKGNKTEVEIICPKHGSFLQTPDKHKAGHGCPICANERKSRLQIIGFNEFCSRSNKIHNGKYGYIENSYNSVSERTEIICPKHGVFRQLAYDHIAGHGCPKCANVESSFEEEIYTFIKSIVPDSEIIRNDRKLLDGREIDILLPEYKIGIECDGLRWHSEAFGKDISYHLSKTEEAEKNGYRLIHIFEDEYVFRKEIVFSKIRHILGKDYGKEKIFARKCKIKEISKKESDLFLENNHIQGKVNASVYIGCFFNDRIVGVMTFKREKSGNYELNRFSTDNSVIAIGIGGKMLSYFVKKYKPLEIKSFADRRWSANNDDNIYSKLGFTIEKILKPDYRYISEQNPVKRIHKFNFRKNILERRFGFGKELTESEMVRKLGYLKIYDCGLLKYVWKKKD